jgi:2-polyprenyl-3-methyl-5-hydroxy-6-metoxy-1,4-benzoquinol methylase
MSLLKTVLRTIWESRRRPAASAGDVGTHSVPGDDPEDVPHATDAPPAWRLLGAQPGVQELDYGDIARPGVRRLFRRPPARLLDIGCASGAVAAGLKHDFPGLWAWGCELNPRAAEVASARLDHFTPVPRSDWSEADLALLSSVDTVLLLDVLEHMYNPWAELEFLARSLSRDAQVIVSLPNAGHVSVLQDLSRGAFPYQPTGILDVTHVRFFTFDGMQAMFEQTGFAVEAHWILSSTPKVDIPRFPAQVAAGNMLLTVDSAQAWERLNAVQFGFRLRPT